MPNYQLKPGKIGKKVIDAYQTTEKKFTGAYKKIENAFIDAFLEETDEPASAEYKQQKDE